MLAAERVRVKHMVQFTNRGLPHYRWIKHLLEDGYIGMRTTPTSGGRRVGIRHSSRIRTSGGLTLVERREL
jgi:predicted dehydrogenase